MSPEQLALLEMYKEQASQARQHETQRERLTGLVIAVAAALVALIATDLDSPSLGLLAPSLFLVFLGVYAAVFSRKHYERYRLHTTVMRGFRDELEARLNNAPLAKIRDTAAKKHNSEFAWLHDKSLHLFWDGLNGSVAIIGFILAVYISIEA